LKTTGDVHEDADSTALMLSVGTLNGKSNQRVERIGADVLFAARTHSWAKPYNPH
jgi:hypothetical protein